MKCLLLESDLANNLVTGSRKPWNLGLMMDCWLDLGKKNPTAGVQFCLRSVKCKAWVRFKFFACTENLGSVLIFFVLSLVRFSSMQVWRFDDFNFPRLLIRH